MIYCSGQMVGFVGAIHADGQRANGKALQAVPDALPWRAYSRRTALLVSVESSLRCIPSDHEEPLISLVLGPIRTYAVSCTWLREARTVL